MTERITDKHLQAVVDRLNRVTGNPANPYIQVEGKLVAQIGNYHLSHAYGGVTLHQMVNAGGGVRDVLYSGYTTKRDLYNLIHAYLRGIEQ